LTFQLVVGVTEELEVGAILLKVEAFGIHDGDGLFRVIEDLAVEIGVQFNWPSRGLRAFFST